MWIAYQKARQARDIGIVIEIFRDHLYIIRKTGGLDKLVEFDWRLDFDEGHVVAHLRLLVAAGKNHERGEENGVCYKIR